MKHETAAEIEGDGTTTKLCEWIQDLGLDEVPAAVKERAKYLILDGIACGLVGTRVPWSEQLAASSASYEPPGKCSVIGHDQVWIHWY